MTIRSRRSALRFESLEQRALLAVVVSPVEQMESVEPVEQLEPVEQVECVELTEQFEQCKRPIIIICPGIETGDDFTPPAPPDGVAPLGPEVSWGSLLWFSSIRSPGSGGASPGAHPPGPRDAPSPSGISFVGCS